MTPERRPNRMMAICAGILAVIAGGYAYYANRQLIDARNTIRQMQAAFSRDQLPAIWVDTSPIDGKAKPPIVLAIDDPIEWTFHYANHGKSPALRIVGRWFVFPGANAKFEVDAFFRELPERMPVTSTQAVAMPGATPERVTARSRDAASPEDFTNASRDGGLYLAGRFEYEGTDGALCRSDFCRFTLRNGATSSCQTHNEIHCGEPR